MKLFIKRTITNRCDFTTFDGLWPASPNALISSSGLAPDPTIPDIATVVAAWPVPSFLPEDIGNDPFTRGVKIWNSSTGQPLLFTVNGAQLTAGVSISPIGGVVDILGFQETAGDSNTITWPTTTNANPSKWKAGMVFSDRRLVPDQYLVNVQDVFKPASSQVTTRVPDATWGYVQTTNFIFDGLGGIKAVPAIDGQLAQLTGTPTGWVSGGAITSGSFYGFTDLVLEVNVEFDSTNLSQAAATDAYLVVPLAYAPLFGMNSAFNGVATFNMAGVASASAVNGAFYRNYAGALGAFVIPFRAIINSDLTISANSSGPGSKEMRILSNLGGAPTAVASWNTKVQVSRSPLAGDTGPDKTSVPTPSRQNFA